jgi:hypothetical protein
MDGKIKRQLKETTVAPKQAIESCFVELIEAKKNGAFSFYLLLHEIEYKMAWRFLRTCTGERAVCR